MAGYVYFMTNKKQGVLYHGVTGNLATRIYQHRNLSVDGFTKRYNLTKLVYIERYDFIEDAIKREKQLKNWKRDWKMRLIESQNPDWDDLFDTLNA